MLRSPLVGVSGTPVAPGLFAVVGVLLGSTAYDSFAESPWWVTRLQSGPLGAEVTGKVPTGWAPAAVAWTRRSPAARSRRSSR